MEIKIITDSSCDLTQEMAKKIDVEMIPIPIMLPEEDKSYLDGVDITPQELFDGMLAGKVYTTSQINLSSYIEAFEKYYKNKQPALYLSLSSGLSSTFNTSKAAIKKLDEEYGENYVTAYDTKSGSFGMGLLVSKIVQISKKAHSMDEIITKADKIRENLVHLFCVTNLEYLQRGGRISKATEIFGKLLSVKPILFINKEGKLEIVERVKGRKKIIKYFIESIKKSQESSGSKVQEVWVSHAMDDEMFGMVKSALASEFGYSDEQIITSIAGATIGAHTGPGSIYMFYLTENVDI